MWKRDRIVPVFKKNDRSEIKNYRPISILSNFAKVYEEAGVYPACGADLSSFMREMKVWSLAERQKHQCAKFSRKLLNGALDCSYLLSKVNIKVPRLTSRSAPDFRLATPSFNLLIRAPIYCACKSANGLRMNTFSQLFRSSVMIFFVHSSDCRLERIFCICIIFFFRLRIISFCWIYIYFTL